jgi:hypothetical protein
MPRNILYRQWDTRGRHCPKVLKNWTRCRQPGVPLTAGTSLAEARATSPSVLSACSQAAGQGVGRGPRHTSQRSANREYEGTVAGMRRNSDDALKASSALSRDATAQGPRFPFLGFRGGRSPQIRTIGGRLARCACSISRSLAPMELRGQGRGARSDIDRLHLQ